MKQQQQHQAWSYVVRCLALAGGREKVDVFHAEMRKRRARAFMLGIRLATGEGYLRRAGDEYELTQKARDHFSQQFEADYLAQRHVEASEAERLAAIREAELAAGIA